MTMESRIPKKVSSDTVEKDISGEISPVIKSFSLSVSNHGQSSSLAIAKNQKLLFLTSDFAQAFRLHKDSVPHSLVSYNYTIRHHFVF